MSVRLVLQILPLLQAESQAQAAETEVASKLVVDKLTAGFIIAAKIRERKPLIGGKGSLRATLCIPFPR